MIGGSQLVGHAVVGVEFEADKSSVKKLERQSSAMAKNAGKSSGRSFVGAFKGAFVGTAVFAAVGKAINTVTGALDQAQVKLAEIEQTAQQSYERLQKTSAYASQSGGSQQEATALRMTFEQSGLGFGDFVSVADKLLEEIAIGTKTGEYGGRELDLFGDYSRRVQEGELTAAEASIEWLAMVQEQDGALQKALLAKGLGGGESQKVAQLFEAGNFQEMFNANVAMLRDKNYNEASFVELQQGAREYQKETGTETVLQDLRAGAATGNLVSEFVAAQKAQNEIAIKTIGMVDTLSTAAALGRQKDLLAIQGSEKLIEGGTVLYDAAKELGSAVKSFWGRATSIQPRQPPTQPKNTINTGYPAGGKNTINTGYPAGGIGGGK